MKEFVTTLFVVVTFQVQRKQFQEPFLQAYRERFENTLFNMLSMSQGYSPMWINTTSTNRTCNL